MRAFTSTLSVLLITATAALLGACGGGEATVEVQATTPVVTVQTQPQQNYTEEWIHTPVRIGFPTGGILVDEETRRQIVEVVRSARARTDLVRVRVEGHTDPRGEDANNQQLSLSRAQAVAEVMVAEGVPREMIETVGYGDSQPLTSNSTSQDLSINRRVEFSVLVRRDGTPGGI